MRSVCAAIAKWSMSSTSIWTLLPLRPGVGARKKRSQEQRVRTRQLVECPAVETGNPRSQDSRVLLQWRRVQDSNSKTLTERNTDWLRLRSSTSFGAGVLIAEDSEADIFFLL